MRFMQLTPEVYERTRTTLFETNIQQGDNPTRFHREIEEVYDLNKIISR